MPLFRIVSGDISSELALPLASSFHAQQYVRFTACKRPAAAGATERSANNVRPPAPTRHYRIFPHLSKGFSRDAWLAEIFNRPPTIVVVKTFL